ncbi:hypothetical protein ACXR0O_21915 [Verrucomicrobiota bacterium sgz303538]
MPAYCYFEIAPSVEAATVPFDEALSIIRIAFPEHELDESAAINDAKHRHSCLVALNAPKEITALYENPRVIRIRITDDWCDGAYLEFDLWDKQGILAYPRPDEECLNRCQTLARKLAEVLGYDCSIEEYD